MAHTPSPILNVCSSADAPPIWLTLIVLWAAIAAAFLALQRTTSWSLLFPVTGLVWVAAPLILTGVPTRSLVLASVGVLVAAGTFFLALVWLAVAVLGLFVPLVTGGE